MLVALILLFIAQTGYSQSIFIEEDESNLTLCVEKIFSTHFIKSSVVTHVSLGPYESNKILKSVNSLDSFKLVTRTAEKRMEFPYESYLITAGNITYFKEGFKNLKKEANFKPDVQFMIILSELDANTLEEMFKILLDYKVYQALIINGTNSADLYSYDPFESYACGKYFTGYIAYGECSTGQMTDLYKSKLNISLKKCIFNAVVAHWPPYTVNPKDDNNTVKLVGTEQHVLNILSDLEGFKINYTYNFNGEEFSTINEDMTASGPLSQIQKENVDMMFSGMLLIKEHSEAFSYLNVDEAYSDDLTIFVKKAASVPIWKNMYLEFTLSVWILLGFSFVVFFIFLVSLFRIKDKCALILIMWDQLFQHTRNLNVNMKMKWILFHWVAFALLINLYYQSNLMSLTTHVSNNYQISNEDDLPKYNMQPCISPVIKNAIKVIKGNDINHIGEKNCDYILESIEAVAKDNNKYTIALYSIYKHNRHIFNDAFGDSYLHAFKKPYSKVIYAVYLYKGFPMVNKLSLHILYMHQGGLVNKHMRDLYYEMSRKHFYAKKHFRARFIFPWQILAIGYSVASLVLTLELIQNVIC